MKNENRRKFLKRTAAFTAIPLLINNTSAFEKYKNEDWFENELKPHLVKIVERYRELNQDGKRQMIGLLDDGLAGFEAGEARNLLLSFRDALLVIK